MGYKQIDQNMTFAEVSLLKSMEHNRSLKRLEKINQIINWSQVEELLMAHYTIGSSREGADAYLCRIPIPAAPPPPLSALPARH
jgi:transposase, IS5 family